MKPNNIVSVNVPINQTQSKVLSNVIQARIDADKKWGQESGCYFFLDNPKTGLTVLMEEVGEVARAILEKDAEGVERELYDCIQVCVAWVESIENDKSEKMREARKLSERKVNGYG